jgi:hypothetical protein
MITQVLPSPRQSTKKKHAESLTREKGHAAHVIRRSVNSIERRDFVVHSQPDACTCPQRQSVAPRLVRMLGTQQRLYRLCNVCVKPIDRATGIHGQSRSSLQAGIKTAHTHFIGVAYHDGQSRVKGISASTVVSAEDAAASGTR